MDQPTPSLKPLILVAPLDWGLGHATRCIPVINSLRAHGARIIIAAEGRTKALLQAEFPDLLFIHLKGYCIRYAKTKWLLPFLIARQIPKILTAIRSEHKALAIVAKTHHIQGIISDNRYGFYLPSVSSIFLTHQLLIKTPLGRWTEAWLQRINYRYINRFNACWIPDNEGADNLAAALSHPQRKPQLPLHYTGPLSRFQKQSVPAKHLLVLLSGPEPQRTLLEVILMKQLPAYNGSVVLVRGLPGATDALPAPPHVTVHQHLDARSLNEAIEAAKLVVARCGYSTVMDLALLQKKSILIPTPGQTEQEYLSRHLTASRFALCLPQKKFDLAAAVQKAESFPYAMKAYANDGRIDAVVGDWLKQLGG